MVVTNRIVHNMFFLCLWYLWNLEDNQYMSLEAVTVRSFQPRQQQQQNDLKLFPLQVLM